MPDRNEAALNFLLTRRSRPAKTLVAPAPNRQQLAELLTAAARTPDHGMLVPFRFIVLEKMAMPRLADLVSQAGLRLQKSADDITKGRAQFEQSHLAVAVIESPTPSEKIPAIEQTYTAGGVCLSLLNAALAAGWGANWLSGWASHDPTFCKEAFDLSEDERVAGLIHIATEGPRPAERPRPRLETITQWMSE